MSSIIIFDLDDTLINHKMKIPRQTYHILNKFKKLNYYIGIITYNKLVSLVANETNLYKYTTQIYYENIDRDKLFDICLTNIINDNHIENIDRIYYIDDRFDNLQTVKKYNDSIIIFHCTNIYELYKFKYLIPNQL
jgi:hypothetical protein